MAALDMADGLRKMFMAGVGAAALTGEKAGEIVGQLAERGETVVKHGKELNHELVQKAGEATGGIREDLVRMYLEALDAEGRSGFVAMVERVARQIDEEQQARQAAAVKVEIASDGEGQPAACACAVATERQAEGA